MNILVRHSRLIVLHTSLWVILRLSSPSDNLEVIIPIEVKISSLRFFLLYNLDDNRSLVGRLMALEKLDEDHRRALSNNDVK